MNYFGITINTMSLGGLAIATGALVDDAIIDVENVVRRLRENNARSAAEQLGSLEVVYQASAEIRGSVVFATLIIVLVFLPLFLLSSVEGRLLRPLGFAYVVALMASLVVALTVTPALCSFLLPRAKAIVKGHEPWIVSRLKLLYAPSLRWSLDHGWAVLALAAILLAGALGAFTLMGRAFLPEFNEGTLTISAVTLPGTSLAESDQLGSALERVMHTVPEVISTARRTGRAELDEHVQGVESAEIDVDLKMAQRSKAAVLEELREKATLLPGMNVSIGQPISHRIDHMLSGTRANIAVKIFGDDLLLLRSLAKHAHAAMQSIPGVVDLSIEQQTDIPTMKVTVDQVAASRYGVRTGEVTDAIQTAYVGSETGQVLEGQVSFPLVVRYKGDKPSSAGEIERTWIDTPGGAKVPLAALARVREDRGPNFIMREGVQRRIVVQCNVAGRDLRTVVKDIQRNVGAAVHVPQGYRIEYGGQFESEAAASERLGLLSILVVIGILLILMTAFGSARDALIIMLNLPLALVGGVVGVYVSGNVLSVASIIGFITLFGIATRNGIMLISHIRHLLEEEGVTDLREAVMRGAAERVSPILMTALAAGLALIPVALGMGKPGSEIQAPMALVILFGLLSSTALNMVVVPAAYFRFGRRRS